MNEQKTKRLKWQKIGIVVCVVCVLLATTVGATFYGGTADTPRHYAPLNLDFSVRGLTSQLTPTVSYKDGLESTPFQYYENIGYQVNVNSEVIFASVNRTNFTLTTINSGALDCQYRLSFDVAQDVNEFTVALSGLNGYYDFQKYAVPQIAMPFGYTANVLITYTVRFTQEQPHGNATATATISGTYDNISNTIIPLLNPYVLYNAEQYDILGNVIIEDYYGEITFTATQGDDGFGDAGFYLWDSVLDITEPLEELMGTQSGAYVEFSKPVYLYGTLDGIVETVQVNGLVIEEYDGWTDTYFGYNLDPDQTVLVYNYGTDSWSGATMDDDGIVLDELTAEEMRVLHFTAPLSDTFVVSTDESVVLFEYFKSQTTYYTSNPLTSSSSGITSTSPLVDGGMYIRYYADALAPLESVETNRALFDFGQAYGVANSELGGFNSNWIGNAVKGVLDVELIPNFRLSGVLGAVVALCLMTAFLKMFAGG